MKKVVAVFRKKWVVSLIGLLALSALIWFGGPLIAIAGKVPLASPVVRLLVILVLVLIWGLNNLRIQMQANRADREMAAAASGDSPAASAEAPGQSAEEVATLKERFEEALAILRKSDGKRGGRSLYELPWYVIVGPPGSGKTTALVNSGLDFPLADRFGKEALRGVGGTRNCDWWFTNEAVLLDTAGRYVTQDSHAAADSAAWTGFLGLLKKHRRRRPINGALVAISIADIMVQNEQQRSAHVHAIRQRIQELHKELGIRFPIYLLFTKCDLVAGFMEFFDDLGREDRAQVWGFTFPEGTSEDGSAAQHVGAEFDGLIQRLGERVYWRLNQERDTQRRALIQGFPAQMAGLKSTVEQFTRAIFQPSRYEDAPLLRGVYFTSGTQEGTPIDRLMGSLARTFGLDQKVLPSYGGHGRSYFIRDLLTEVIFPEAELAGANRRLERQRAWLQIGAYAGAIVLAALAALAWSTSFTRNAVYVHRIQDRLEQYRKVAARPLSPDADLAQVLPRLDALQAVTQVYGNGDHVPFLMGLGLYQGSRLGGEAQAAYRSALDSLLLPRMVKQLEAQLANPGASPEFRYETLKLYLMLSDPKRLDPAFAKLWFGLDWQHSGSLDADQVRRLQADLATLLQQGFQPIALNQSLVTSVRGRLAQSPLADRLYARLKSDAQGAAVAPFQVSQDVDGAGQVFVDDGGGLKAQVPALFTHAGYQQLFKPESKQIGGELSEDNWVMGTHRGPLGAEERAQVEAAVQQLYFKDYIRHWQNMLATLHVKPFHSLQQGASEVATLAGPSSPMTALLQAVASNTTLAANNGGLTGKLTQAAGAAAGQAAAQRSRLARMFQSAAPSQVAAPTASPAEVVDKQFEQLNGLTRQSGAGQPPIQQIQSVLSELQGHLQRLAGSGGEGVLKAAQSQVAGGNNIIGRLRTLAVQQPQPVRGWLEQIADASVRVTLSGSRAQLNQSYASTVLAQYQQAVQGRFPIDAGAKQDITVDDFARFFGPGGVMDKFFQDYLKPFVDTSHRQWRWRSAGLGLSTAALRDFQRAAEIRRVFFPNGGKQPSVQFGLKPVYLDENVNRALLDIDGQDVSYRHGPTELSTINWPGAQSGNGARLTFDTAAGGQVTTSASGPWALFRFVNQGELKERSPERFLVTFTVGGFKAQYEIVANSVVNPFRMMGELQRFRCPGKL